MNTYQLMLVTGKLRPYRIMRHLEIKKIIKKYDIESVVEYGFGLSSYTFYNSVPCHCCYEENKDWVMYYKRYSCDGVDVRLARVKVDVVDFEDCCFYDIPHTLYSDLVYVDGPVNLFFGKYLPCVDVFLSVCNGVFPRVVMVHGRLRTVDFLRRSLGLWYCGFRLSRQHFVFVHRSVC